LKIRFFIDINLNIKIFEFHGRLKQRYEQIVKVEFNFLFNNFPNKNMPSK